MKLAAGESYYGLPFKSQDILTAAVRIPNRETLAKENPGLLVDPFSIRMWFGGSVTIRTRSMRLMRKKYEAALQQSLRKSPSR